MKRIYEDHGENIICPYTQIDGHQGPLTEKKKTCRIQCPFYFRIGFDENNKMYVQCSCRSPIWKTGIPEKSGRYLIWYEYENIKRPFVADYDNIDGWLSLWPDVKILAWMEIPEYRGDK